MKSTVIAEVAAAVVLAAIGLVILYSMFSL